jgi:hypothetical protein
MRKMRKIGRGMEANENRKAQLEFQRFNFLFNVSIKIYMASAFSILFPSGSAYR